MPHGGRIKVYGVKLIPRTSVSGGRQTEACGLNPLFVKADDDDKFFSRRGMPCDPGNLVPTSRTGCEDLRDMEDLRAAKTYQRNPVGCFIYDHGIQIILQGWKIRHVEMRAFLIDVSLLITMALFTGFRLSFASATKDQGSCASTPLVTN